MNPMPELTPMLKQLRLSGITDSIETRNRQAIEEKLSYMDFLAMVIQDEVARSAWKLLFAEPTSEIRKLWKSSILASILKSTVVSSWSWLPAGL
jgi:hypothetical protein